jgi:tetratricopeptide (TPR) repeat protein
MVNQQKVRIITLAEEVLPQIEEVVNLIQERKLAVLCGAGISINPPSNLPSAIAIRKEIIRKLVKDYDNLNKTTRKKLEGRSVDEKNKKNKCHPQQSDFPFEAFIQIVDKHASILSRLLKIFNTGQPNKNHILLANLIKNGYIRELMTTNFDSKIEEALKKSSGDRNERGKEGIAFKVFSKESDFLNLLKTKRLGGKIPVIMKVHGTVEDKESIRATLESVSKKELREARTQILRYFFQESEHDILILGYSLSDEFDINPVLRSLESKNRIFIIKHLRKDSKEQPSICSLADPFKKFKGTIIKSNTEEIIDYIWSKFVNKPWKKSLANEDWVQIIEEWNQGLRAWQRSFLMGLIFENINDHSNAEKLLKESLEISKASRNQSDMCRSLHQLGTIKTKRGEYAKAEKLYRRSLRIKKRLRDQHAIATSLHQLANLNYLRGKHEEAEDLYKQSLKIFNELNEQSRKAISLNSLATIQTERGNYSEAEKVYTQSLQIFQNLGEQYNIGCTLFYLARIQQEQSNYEEAEKRYTQSSEVFRKIGNESGIVMSIGQLALIQAKRGNYDEAEEILKQTLDISNNLGDQHAIATSLHQLGNLSYLRGQYDKAEDFYKQTLKLRKIIGDHKGLIVIFGALANLEETRNNFHNAVLYYKKTLKLSQKIGLKKYEQRAKDCLRRVAFLSRSQKET